MYRCGSGLGYAVRDPLPEYWLPARPPPVDVATLVRVVEGLNRLQTSLP